MEVQDTIRTMREMNKLTQEEMAEKLNISVNGYSKIERGITKLSLEKLEQIANIFNINVSELYSAKEKGFFCLFSENSQNNSTYYASNNEISFENEKLKLQIKHQEELLKIKEEIIAKLYDENSTLKEIISLLKQK
ncbi:transcriptional regulator [Rodentibacter trehalosifermentans]|uniref:Transcriptional regulator n=1 Tax=Rodentibacter trehalosifermentans TaxID=1908263 RepID=A0A1V3IY46_9PAST|nr:helix-turn-helix transcriptional regulator [Rodentibacter trehalosifermentans]OOF47097.1 transcriptional regulator [Rodentibacter trehalosifermentans]